MYCMDCKEKMGTRRKGRYKSEWESIILREYRENMVNMVNMGKVLFTGYSKKYNQYAWSREKVNYDFDYCYNV